MQMLISKIQAALPGVFVHSVRIGDSPEEDRRYSLFDNMDRQIREVCSQLAAIPELRDGFNAIGLSQGGQFMRAYVERCNAPRVKTLITLGSQHSGVMALPGCRPLGPTTQSDSSTGEQSWFARTPMGRLVSFVRELVQGDSDCSWWKQLVALGVYAPFVRTRVVQAQYFRDPADLDAYYAHNAFLLDINNEHLDVKRRNARYAVNLASLDAFYMYMFARDSVVVPRESSWFGTYDVRTRKIRFLADQPLYVDDWLGLRQLAARNALFFRTLPGEHLHIPADFVRNELAVILAK